jgi:hypothetical protein
LGSGRPYVASHARSLRCSRFPARFQLNRDKCVRSREVCTAASPAGLDLFSLSWFSRRRCGIIVPRESLLRLESRAAGVVFRFDLLLVRFFVGSSWFGSRFFSVREIALRHGGRSAAEFCFLRRLPRVLRHSFSFRTRRLAQCAARQCHFRTLRSVPPSALGFLQSWARRLKPSFSPRCITA